MKQGQNSVPTRPSAIIGAEGGVGFQQKGRYQTAKQWLHYDSGRDSPIRASHDSNFFRLSTTGRIEVVILL